MSGIYHNWEKLVDAVLRREKDRQLALFESFSSSVFSSRPSFDSDVSAGAPSSQSNRIFHIQFVEINLSTQNFNPDMLLGKGRFGSLYKGWIHEHFLTAVKPGSGIAVAIRKLNHRGILRLNQPRHSNLVKIIGYSVDGGNRVMVYQFMPNGSLDNHLFTRGRQPLSWETRLKVAIGAARGLSLLHDLNMLVTCESLKSSSILLDDEFNANWSDFDLTTVPFMTYTTASRVRNDHAYIATGGLTMKSDVYSFGIILLELLCGRRAFDQNRPMKEQNLVEWVKPNFSNKRKLMQIVDSRLEDLYPHDEAYKFGEVAFKCLSLDPKLRPNMTKVVDMLEQFGSHYHQNQTEVQTDSRLEDLYPHDEAYKFGEVAFKCLSLDAKPRPNMTKVVDMLERFGSHYHQNQTEVQTDPSPSIVVLQEVMALQFDVIKEATRNFRPDLLLGEGRSGPVYKGSIHEHPLTGVKLEPGIVVAVKNLSFKRVAGPRESLATVTRLSKLPSHPNLTKLIGYCLDEKNMILVYEFLRLGGLDYHLFTRRDQSLPWEIRLKVAIGTARALAFLHFSGLEIPYRDFNSGDILLDGEFNAKLSDYGQHQLFDFSLLKFGYGPPETLAAGHVYAKSNVYNFGVVLLELVTGHPAFYRGQPLKELTSLGNRRKVMQIVDSRLEGRFSHKEVYKVVKLASRCVMPDPKDRPAMSEVAAILEQLCTCSNTVCV